MKVKKSKFRSAKKKGKARFFLVLVFLIIALFFVNGIFKGISLTNFFSRPISFSPAIFGQKVKGSNLWDGKTKVNIAIASDPVLVVSVSQIEKNIKILAISKDTYSDVPGGYGWYRLGATYGLGQLENPPRGGQLFAKAVSIMTKVPIDYWMVDKEKPFFPVDSDKVLGFKDDFLGFGGIFPVIKNTSWAKKNLDTNCTLFDVYRAWWLIKSYRFSKENYLDLSSDYLEEIVLPDNSRGYVPRQGRFEILATKIFSDPQIGSENLTVGIVNATKVDGLGEKVDNMLANIDARVMKVETAQDLSPKSKILVSGSIDRNSYTVERLSKFLGIGVEKSKEIEDVDVGIILGEDWSF
jgi:hypothetical protein